MFRRLFDEAQDAAGDHGELRYAELMMRVLAEVGVRPGDGELREALRLEHRAWDEARTLHPDTPRLLAALREAGLATGLVSNAFDPPELMHEDLRIHGIAALLDAAGSPQRSASASRTPRSTAMSSTGWRWCPSGRCSSATASARTSTGRPRWGCRPAWRSTTAGTRMITRGQPFVLNPLWKFLLS